MRASNVDGSKNPVRENLRLLIEIKTYEFEFSLRKLYSDFHSLLIRMQY